VIPEIHVLIDLFDYKNIAKSQPHANVKQLWLKFTTPSWYCVTDKLLQISFWKTVKYWSINKKV
jgi:hypothetical protein